MSRTETGEKICDKCDDAADASKQLENPERRYAKTLQTTAWVDLQQNELAESSADMHHNMKDR